jgi:hypothetical protein
MEGTGALGEPIDPGCNMPLDSATNVPVKFLSETANYRVGLLVAFDPDFLSVVEIYSTPFRLIPERKL